MDKTTKQKIIQKAGKYFSVEERHQIIRELLATGCTKVELWEKYTGEGVEHGRILRWMKALGYSTGINPIRLNIVPNLDGTPMKRKKLDRSSETEDQSFENLQLKKRIAELEKQLKDAELKAIAYSTMVDIAEKEYKIPIRKKLNTKP